MVTTMIKCKKEGCKFECMSAELMAQHEVRCLIGITEYQERQTVKGLKDNKVNYNDLSFEDKQKALLEQWKK